MSVPYSESKARKCRLPLMLLLFFVVCLFKFSVTFICTTCNLAITKNKEIRKEKQCVRASANASVFKVASHRHLSSTSLYIVS